MTESSYPYGRGNLLEDRNTYFYTQYQGKEFLKAWRQSRDALLAFLPKALPPSPVKSFEEPVEFGKVEMARLLEFLAAKMERDGKGGLPEIKPWMDRLVQRFEISKRIYDVCNSELRATTGSTYRDLGLYIRFGQVMVTACQVCSELTYLNVLLKLLDTLASLHEKLDEAGKGRLAWLIHQERDLVESLAAGLRVSYAT